jgi:hypothetical protein
MGSLHTNTLMRGGGSSLDGMAGREGRPEIVGFASILGREIGGIPIAESIAWVELDGNGRVSAETLYWPAIPKSVTSKAAAFHASVTGPNIVSFTSKLPKTLSPNGRVVIHHTPHWKDMVQQYDVSFDAQGTSSEGKQTRHFDENGNEFRLPYEVAISPGDRR